MDVTDDIAFVFIAHDAQVEAELREALPDADIEGGDNAVGGATIAAFAGLSLHVLKTVLAFLSARETRLGPTTLRIGKEDITITGYTADEAERLLKSEPVQNALAQLNE